VNLGGYFYDVNVMYFVKLNMPLCFGSFDITHL